MSNTFDWSGLAWTGQTSGPRGASPGLPALFSLEPLA